jgi:hypothetical protein
VRHALAALLLAVAAAPAAAQTWERAAARDTLRDDRRFSFHDRGPYRPAVPRPDALLGYAVGAWHTQYAAQERALLAIAAAAPDRVVVEEIGTTAERRTMRVFIVTAPEHLRRLDAIRGDLQRLADPRGVAPAELEAIAARTPATVMLSHSVHGDEVPGFESAMQVLYQLAASEEPATLDLLRKTIVIINPSSNPDGHERFAVWSNSVAVGSPEPVALEQQGGQPWATRGRFNHYRFDMNRDLIGTTQREVRALVATMLRWRPMVHADLHGYAVPFYFAPPANPVNANVGPAARRMLEAIGRGNASAFDRYGWLYYVRDVFDLYYPGYYDTWPSLTGAAGTTYETDGGPALLKRRADGTLLSLRDGIAKHYTAALATIATTAERAAERVRDYAAFRQQAVRDGQTGPVKRFVFTDGTDPARAAELAATLLRAGVEVRRTTAPLASARAHAFADDRVGAQAWPAGAYVVDLAQPQGKLAKAVLEPDPELDPAFRRTQEEKFRRNQRRGAEGFRDGYEFYDVTAWSLAVAFGVPAWWTEDAPAATGDLLTLPTDGPLVNGERLPVAVRGGIVRGRPAASSYLFRNDRNGAARLAGRLLQDGVRVNIAAEPLDVDGEAWPRGTYVVYVTRNAASVHETVDALAREAGVEVVGVNTAFPAAAQFSTGSGVVAALEAPRIAVVAGDGVSHTAYGAVWWTLEQRYGLLFTPVTADALVRALDRFNVVIVPDASGAALGRAFGAKGERLREWMQRGGTLITMAGATAWAATDGVAFTSARAMTADDGKATAKKDSAAATAAPADTLIPLTSPGATPDRPEGLPGSHFDVALDRTHWLTLGFDQSRLTVLLDGGTFLKPSKDGSNVAVFPKDGLLRRGGFTWPDNTERLLRGSVYLVEEPIGAGHYVGFVGEPFFRGWWRALDRLVLNAVLLGSGF